MNEVEMSRTLGILVDPDKNRVKASRRCSADIIQVCRALREINHQKERFGTLNQDLWLEFVPWHSLN